MSKLPEDFNKYDFEKLYKNERNPNTKERLLALQHLKEGKSKIEVGKILKRARRTIGEWYKRFLDSGLEGLVNQPRSGRNPNLAKKNEKVFLKELDKLQDERGGGRVVGEDIKQMLQEKFNADYHVNSVYRLLDRLDIVWITGRSIHPKADKEAQEEFKKKLPRFNKKKSPRTHSSRHSRYMVAR